MDQLLPHCKGAAVIDPTIHWHSVQANRRIAVLLWVRSSRLARIPTGWEITPIWCESWPAWLEKPAEPDPAAWYRNKYDKEPDYSALLDALARHLRNASSFCAGILRQQKPNVPMG